MAMFNYAGSFLNAGHTAETGSPVSDTIGALEQSVAAVSGNPRMAGPE